MGFPQKKKWENTSTKVRFGSLWNTAYKKTGEWHANGSFTKDAFKGIDPEHFFNNLDQYWIILNTNKEEWKKSENAPDLLLYVDPKQPKDAPVVAPKVAAPSIPAPVPAPVVVEEVPVDAAGKPLPPWKRK